jgi:hypothetical protein
MLGIVATLKVKPGMEREFEALATGDSMEGRAELRRLREIRA